MLCKLSARLSPRVGRVLSLTVIVLLVALASGASARAAAGDLDLSFGVDGKVLTDLGALGHDQALAAAIQHDGKIVAVGLSDTRGGDFAVVRYDADGSLDAGFGSGGKVLTDLGSETVDDAFAVALQADGKIVVAGRSRAADIFSFTLALVRYEADGSLDVSFGSGGRVLTQLEAGSSDEAYGVAVQPDGRIVAAGMSFTFGAGNGDFAVVRYDADGSLDAGFGSGGKVLTDFGAGAGEQARALALQSDGKIVAAGHSRAGGGLDFALARYSLDGSLDAGFGTGGKVLTEIGPGRVDDAYAVAVQADGKIVAAGSSEVGDGDFALARYNADGSLDSGFGSGGTVITDIRSGSHDGAFGLAVQTDGRILAAGLGAGDFALARYNADGSFDPGFGSGGTLRTALGVGTFDEARAVAVQPDGKIVAVGLSQFVDERDFALVRYIGLLTPSEQVDALAALVDSYQLGKLGSSLHDKLVTVQRFLAADKLRQAEDNLASFIAQVDAQRGKGLSLEQADALREAALLIMDAIEP